MDLTDEEVTRLLLLPRLLQAGPVDPGQESMNGGCGQRQRGWLPRGDTFAIRCAVGSQSGSCPSLGRRWDALHGPVLKEE